MRKISDWQRCQYPARYGIHTGRKQTHVCVGHLQVTVEDVLSESVPGKDNVSGVLVFTVRPKQRTGYAPVKCDYTFRESMDTGSQTG